MGKGAPDAGGAEKKEKKVKEPKAKVEEEYDGQTCDAAVVAASRLSHIFKGELQVDDILAYLYQIALHYLATTICLIFAFVWYLDLEHKEDPWEAASVNLMKNSLLQAQNSGVALTNITTPLLPLTNITTPLYNFTKEDGVFAQYTLTHCEIILKDFPMLHIMFLTIFCGSIVSRLFKLIHRIYVLALLPVDDYKKWEGYEKLGDAAEEKDEFTYSVRNWNGTHNQIVHMSICMKIVVMIFILIPDILFTMVALYTGLKLFGTSVGSPVKLAKQALKASFLLKFSTMYYTNFTSHNMKIYLVGGKYWIPQTKDEAKGEKSLQEDEEQVHDLTGWDLWYSWGSFLAKIIIGFGIAIIYMQTKEFPKIDLERACSAYKLSPGAVPYSLLEFPLTPWDSIDGATIIQKIFYVHRS